MIRRKRVAVLGVLSAGAMLSSGALAPAAGDQRVTGGPPAVSYTEDGVPFVRSGPECAANKGAGRKHSSGHVDASDF